MDAYYFFEEELITKMHTSFTDRFNLDHGSAAELTWEILELLKISESNLYEIHSLYLQ